MLNETILTVNWNHPWIEKYAEYIQHFKNEAVKQRSNLSKPIKEESTTSVLSVYKINKMLKYLFLEMNVNPDGLYDSDAVLN